MKKYVSAVVTLLVLIIASFAVASVYHAKFFDVSFLVGLIITAIIYVFTTKGGFTSDSLNFQTQSISRIKQNKEEVTLDLVPKIPLLISVIFTVVNLIVMVGMYWDSF